MDIWFGLLGPMEVRRDGTTLTIVSRRQRHLLAALLLEPNTVVPLDRLMQATWDDAPPLTARTQVHHCVSVLRRALGPEERIVTHPTGYLLRADPHEVDAASFDLAVQQSREHADRGRSVEAAATLRQGLSYWRGRALAGMDNPMLAAGARVLDERRILARERLVELELALGRHREIVPELRSWLHESPLRQRLAGLLMTVLHHCGQQEEALMVYHDLRALLVERHGLEPGPELQAIQRAILVSDQPLAGGVGTGTDQPVAGGPVLDHTGPEPVGADHADPDRRDRLCQLPPAPSDVTGRRDLVATIASALTGPRDGLPIVVLSGTPGVGKSTLALYAAHQVRSRFPDGQIYLELGSDCPDAVGPSALLGRCLRALGVPDSAQPHSVAERSALYRDRLADRQVLVVLDDAVRAADVIPLLPGARDCAVLVTSRHRMPELAGATHLAVSTFAPQEAVTLLRRLAGAGRIDAEPETAAEIVQLCGHLPLAVRVAGARLAVRPGWRLAQLARRLRDELARLDELSTGELQVRASFAVAYRELPQPARRLLRRLSLLRVVDLPVLAAAAVLDCPIRPAEALLERLVDASLMDAAEDRSGQLRYRMHDLIRLYGRERAMAEESPAQRDAAVARVVAAWLARAEECDDQLATRTLAPIRTDAMRWRPTGDRLAATESARSWFEAERATVPVLIRHATALRLTSSAWQLAAACQAYHELSGAYDDALDVHQMALAACAATGDRLGTAVMLRNRADLWIARPGADRQDKLRDARSALEIFRELGVDAGACDAWYLCADVHRATGAHRRARQCLDAALTAATRANYLLGECHAVAHLAVVCREQGRPEEAITLAERYLALVGQVHGHRERSVALNVIGLVCRDLGQVDRAETAIRSALEISRLAGDPAQETYTLVRLGQLLVRRDPPQAAVVLRDGLARSRAQGLGFGEAVALAGLGELALVEGRTADAIAELTRAVEMLHQLRAAFVAAQASRTLGQAYHEHGDPAGASRSWTAARELFDQIGNEDAVRQLDRQLGASTGGVGAAG
ncbi:BTAD domain-containing putative transcriptional regulator [Solwaraspora sp. WMMD406]|uniref:AfsR/SARP family transcriptional regulator n=1 Tax=Solwaraspora sp. WMMD406 TaxID=3016095 RepID=UPI0024169CA8|nr:BTAD domain-containing putative transcriptional regulator [Solwaraspora sp. WMMD406]MDG4765680.1 BTAD domain-containing putative transcriptional regulator [Solwaraspora sp. WMMD406]